MKVLLLSAYAARSHLHWQRSVESMFPDFSWRSLSLPPRHFAWRVRGNPLYWGLEERAVLEADFDILVATSMVDLCTLRGLVPSLSRLPSLLYFHENQFAYPRGRGRHEPVEAQMVSLYAALAAQRLAFNSAFNRDSFLTGVGSLLARLPDHVPSGVVEHLAGKAELLPVPIATGASAPVDSLSTWAQAGRHPDRPLRLLWVGRFEHDKGGDRLLPLLAALQRQGLDFEIAITGQQFRQSPPGFAAVQSRFASHIVQFGNLEAHADLLLLMARADVVLSTALHEFQGLAVLEAVQQGCIPVVPDRLAYREMYPPGFRYASHPDDADADAAAAAKTLITLATSLAQGEVRAPAVTGWTVAALRPRYARVLSELAGDAAPHGLNPP